ncbi:mapeg family [Trichoderma arundinaceum]|uniref:Mapeg family n=1 Tax=Trichoderma arundinaceum TaxID=490622 RepID=A0A395NYK5_TRIAR|nr:mapeg family [Trichoderma arundinaceum]
MPFTLVLPDSYGFVLAAATSTIFVNSLHMLRTSKFRKASKITYPNAYATHEQAEKDPAAYKFNCAQRAHANYVENQTSALVALLIAGLNFPVASAICGATWAFGRTLYLYGYTSSAGPKGRSFGAYFAGAADLALKLMAVYTSYAIATGK